MRALHEQMLHSPNYHVDDNCGNFSTSSRPWWRQVVCRTLELGGIDKPNRAPQFDEYFEHLFQYFSTAEPYKLYPDTELALKRLRELHPTACLACLSNSDERLRSILDGLGIAGDFDLILDSRSIGSKKPDQKFFSTAMFKSGVDGLEPMECLYIGDDMERDYLGALNAGWNAKLLNRNVSTTAQVKSTISSLLDI
jgi:REG-2-like HAD superfamily hydrolase